MNVLIPPRAERLCGKFFVFPQRKLTRPPREPENHFDEFEDGSIQDGSCCRIGFSVDLVCPAGLDSAPLRGLDVNEWQVRTEFGSEAGREAR